MSYLLDNPVYFALSTGDADKAFGSGHVKYFDIKVSPFVGFPEQYTDGFKELHHLLPNGRNILFASRKEIAEPKEWKIIRYIPGSQFLYVSKEEFSDDFSNIVPLHSPHVEQMINLTSLTKPGPFDKRTIEFGNYFGIFDGDRLIAMAGNRLHVNNYTEISAVCTHPDFLGKGFAGKLLKHQINLIIKENEIPFLHVRSDNKRAIDLYERLGFSWNGPMHFYFMQKSEEV